MDNMEVRLNMYHPSRANMGTGSVETLANILMPKNDAIAFVENLNPKETFSLPKSKERYILMCSPINVRTIENPTQVSRIDLIVKSTAPEKIGLVSGRKIKVE